MHVAEAGCLYLFRGDVQPQPEPENAKMRRGKSIHEAIERGLLEKPWSGHASPEVARAVEWANERWPDGVCVETPIGIDPRTGIARQYASRDAIPAYQVAAIVDVHDGGASVYDWKTGSQFSKFDYEPQVRLNGYAVASLYGLDEIDSGLAYVNVDGVVPKTWPLDMFDLALQKEKLRVWSEQAPTAEPTPCSACRYCPARTICPAMQQKEAG